MHDVPRDHSPFNTLGKHLRLLRENTRETVAEVSGAIEIDSDELERIEKGERRPTEDVLSLLINHFAIQDQEATQLWESAGYERNGDELFPEHLDDLRTKATVILLALNIRAEYSDGFNLAANKHGIVMNFTQTGERAQPLSVSRIGMSYEHAEEVMGAIQRAVLFHRYMPKQRLLPPGNAVQ